LEARAAGAARVEDAAGFNLLGPLANPAGARMQLIGAPSSHAAELMAAARYELGTDRSFAVLGHGGLDEISTTGAAAGKLEGLWAGPVKQW